MTRPSATRARGVLGPLLAVAVMLLLVPAVARAEPVQPLLRRVSSQPLGSVTATAGPAAATLEPGSFAYAADSGYSFTAKVRVPGKADFVQMRFKVLNPSGKLMIQRTVIQSNVRTGQATAQFERELSDLELAPGSYPVSLEVRVAQDGQITQTTLESELRLYDPEGPRVPVVFAARISGQPLAGPSGKFVADPAIYTRARDDARSVAAWVLGNQEARMTLAISPLLLEEWRRVSEGYVVTGPEGDTRVEPNEPVPLAYAEALDTIRRAVDTTRLELAHLGYTDPNLSDLSLHGLARDVRPQYAQGLSATFASLETTPSTGTVVAGGCMPPETVESLVAEDVSYGIVEPACTRSGKSTAAPGAYRVKGTTFVALVADEPAEVALGAGDNDAIAGVAFQRRAAGSSSPLVIRGNVGPGALAVEEFTQVAEAITSQTWTHALLGREASAPKPRRTLSLRAGRGSPKTPPDYWDDVRSGRAWAGALAAGLGPDTPETVTAQRDSLVAQCSAWAGPAGDWALADRGRAFAANATRLGRSVFDGVSLAVKPVTLAGSSGEVPVIVSNASDSVLSLRITAIPSREVRLGSKRSTLLEVLPKDNFIELPVDLRDALSGRLTVTVSAGSVVLEQDSVTLRASYLDRLVMILGVVLVLGAILAFIVRRVRAVESAGTNNKDATDRARPTSPGSDT